MIKRIIKRWKELREDGFGKLSIKDTIIFMIREKIKHKWHSFIVNRYGKDCGWLRDIINADGDKDSLSFGCRYSHLDFLYYDAKEDTKEDILNKLMVSVKLLYDYQSLHRYTSARLKTSAKTEQYYEAEWKIYCQTQIWTDWGECEGFMTDGHCEHCDGHIKIESDRIKKELKLK